MSLAMATAYALLNPIKPRGRNSISRFGAAVIGDGKVFLGWNDYKTHPLQFKFSQKHEACSAHAEIMAIKKAVNHLAKKQGTHYKDVTDLSRFRLYVARVLKNGTPVNAQPCEFCQNAIDFFNIKHTEWTS